MEKRGVEFSSLISRALSKALDKIGVNENMRKKYYECCVIMTIAEEFLNINENNVRDRPDELRETFGSYIEGTSTNGMRSDHDIVQVAQDDVIELNDENTIIKGNKTVGIVTDNFTPPGYVKLKVNEDHRYFTYCLVKVPEYPQFLSNQYLDSYVDNFVRFLNGESSDLTHEQNGPALTIFSEKNCSIRSKDCITAFHCKQIISCAQEYFNRERKYGWPSKSTLNTLKGQGCLFVPKGHALSEDTHKTLQWRVSFSFQERHLMLNLNNTQYKAYVLLKLMRKTHISPFVKLTSYHCKTALFHTIENNPSDIWNEPNLLQCFTLCVECLIKWSEQCFCPNYFLLNHDLFVGKLENDDFTKLVDILRQIKNDPFYHFMRIYYDRFGELVGIYMLNNRRSLDVIESNDRKGLILTLQTNLQCDTSIAIFRIRNVILKKISWECFDDSEIVRRHYKWLETLCSMQERKKVGHVSLNGLEWVLPHVSRFIHSSLGSHLTIKATEIKDRSFASWYLATAAFHFHMGLNSDALSSKMKLATVLLYTGHLKPDTLANLNKFKTLSVCSCIDNEHNNLDALYRKRQSPKMLQLETPKFIEEYISACTVFLPSEEKIIPSPLKYELHGCVGCKISMINSFVDKKIKICRTGFDKCVLMDSKTLNILLRIQIHKSTNSEIKELNIRILEKYSLSEYIEHKDTTLNILGWLESEHRISSKSLLYYSRSLEYTRYEENKMAPEMRTNYKNAAKLHIVVLLYRAWRTRMQNQNI